MKVELTVPMPGNTTPSLPCAGSILIPFEIIFVFLCRNHAYECAIQVFEMGQLGRSITI